MTAPNRQQVLTRKLPMTYSRDVVRVNIQKPGSGNIGAQTMTHIKSETRIESRADFVLEIDYDGLVRQLFGKAAYSKGGKAQLAGGLIRLTKRNEKIEKSTPMQHPVREGWAEVEP